MNVTVAPASYSPVTEEMVTGLSYLWKLFVSKCAYKLFKAYLPYHNQNFTPNTTYLISYNTSYALGLFHMIM